MVAVEITPFQPADQDAVKQLVLDGLVDHWGFLDPTKNPDLNEIAKTYRKAQFLVARHDGEIIGCGALFPRSAQHAEIVRMSVKKAWRGQHIGKMILTALMDAARERGIMHLILETTETWTEVVAFYQRNGFEITHYLDGDVYLERYLTRQKI